MKIKVFKDQLKILTLDKNSSFSAISKTILKLWKNFEDISIVNLALNANVSIAGVGRFCKYIGLSGFKQLKVLILEANHEIEISKFNAQETYEENPFIKNYCDMKNKINEHILFWQNSKLAFECMQQIMDSSKTYIFAFGLAADVTKSFVRRVKLLNVEIEIISDISIIESIMTFIKSTDYCIFISLLGNNNYLHELSERLWFYKITKNQTAIVGLDYKSKFTNVKKISIDIKEYGLWDSFSLTSQTLMTFFDLVYMNILNKIE